MYYSLSKYAHHVPNTEFHLSGWIVTLLSDFLFTFFSRVHWTLGGPFAIDLKKKNLNILIKLKNKANGNWHLFETNSKKPEEIGARIWMPI